MRQALLVLIAASAGLGACTPVGGAGYGYGYAVTPAPSTYGYYDGGYAPGPYYAEPGYAPYVAPGPAIIVGGGERRWERERYRDERPRYEGGFRGNPNPPGRDFGRSAPPPQNLGGNRPGPSPVAAARPAPPPQAIPAPPSGGPAFEQWNRTHINASPSLSDQGPR